MQAATTITGMPVTLISDEPFLPYYRMRIEEIMTGKEPSSLFIHPDEWYKEKGIEYINGHAVLITDSAVELEDGRKQLEDGKAQLTASQKEIDSARSQYESGLSQWKAGQAEYESGLAEYEARKPGAQAQIRQGEEELAASRQQLDEGWAEYQQMADVLAGYDAGIAELEENIQKIKDQLAAMDENPGGETGENPGEETGENPGGEAGGEDREHRRRVDDEGAG